MVVSGLTHAAAALPQREPSVPTELQDGWATDSVWTDMLERLMYLIQLAQSGVRWHTVINIWAV
jgi:hypothetical protein